MRKIKNGFYNDYKKSSFIIVSDSKYSLCINGTILNIHKIDFEKDRYNFWLYDLNGKVCFSPFLKKNEIDPHGRNVRVGCLTYDGKSRVLFSSNLLLTTALQEAKFFELVAP